MKNVINLYVDIDGVLLTKKQEIPKGAIEFIDFITNRYDCFWLTTHCREGENKAIQYLEQFYAELEMDKLRKIKATNWRDLKTEGINFSIDFIWLDDYPFESELRVLEANDRKDNLIKVDLNQRNELERVMHELMLFEQVWK